MYALYFSSQLCKCTISLLSPGVALIWQSQLVGKALGIPNSLHQADISCPCSLYIPYVVLMFHCEKLLEARN